MIKDTVGKSFADFQQAFMLRNFDMHSNVTL